MTGHTDNNRRIHYPNGQTQDVCQGCLDRYQAIYGQPFPYPVQMLNPNGKEPRP